jgi:hypothetical protein
LVALLQMLLTGSTPPMELAPLRRALKRIISTNEQTGFLAKVKALRAAAEVVATTSRRFIDPFSGAALQVALLEEAVSMAPDLRGRLQLIATILRGEGLMETLLSEPIARIPLSCARGRVEALVTPTTDELFACVADPKLLEIKGLADAELETAILCLRLRYIDMRIGFDQDGRRSSKLIDDFDVTGLPLWHLIADEACRRSAVTRSMRVMCDARSIAKVRLSLLPATPANRTPMPSVPPPALPSSPLSVTICRSPIPPSSDKQDKAEIERHLILETPLPVARMPDLADIDRSHGRLRLEFPWAENALSAIFDEVRGRSALGLIDLAMPPTLLVGLPGSGKSRLGRRLAEELRLPSILVPLGGSADSKVLCGTSRGWSTGRPSDLVTHLAQIGQASAMVLLDEVDKAVGSHGRDIGITSYLLGLLERETAARHRDCFLKTECDLSHLQWLLTANRLSALQPALRSRLRILLVREPSPEHHGTIARHAIDDMAKRWGIGRDVLPEIDELALPWSCMGNARQVCAAVEAAVMSWAREITRH